MSNSHPVTCICPGSYDPVTNGHLDIIRRAAGIFERVIVGVVRDPQHKSTMFSVDERVEFLREALADVPNVEVEVFSDLVVEFARRFGARTMVKGLRAISDFEWEFQMHHLNRNLAPEVETMYLMSSPQYSFLSSSGVKEVASFGGDVREDAFWRTTLGNVARRFGERPRVSMNRRLVSARFAWRNARNVVHNAAIRTTLRRLRRRVEGLAARAAPAL